jgi:hypothetical protein
MIMFEIYFWYAVIQASFLAFVVHDRTRAPAWFSFSLSVLIAPVMTVLMLLDFVEYLRKK